MSTDVDRSLRWLYFHTHDVAGDPPAHPGAWRGNRSHEGLAGAGHVPLRTVLLDGTRSSWSRRAQGNARWDRAGSRDVSREGMASLMAVKYLVEYRRDESGWWQARIPAVRGCHTQGRTVAEARKRIREALALFVDDAKKATLVDDVKLPAEHTRVIRAFKDSQREIQAVQRRASMACLRIRETPFR